MDKTVSMATETWSLPKHIPELDGIRGVACLMVLIHHYITGIVSIEKNTALWYAEAITRPFMLSGVDLFFVLSGFLIGGILMDNRGSRSYFKTFYIRRICRIFPVYYLVFASFATILLLGLPERLPQLSYWLFREPMPLWTYATFTQNFAIAQAGHAGAKWIAITWSLAVEEQFYLLFPAIVFFLPRKYLVHVAIAGIIVAPICRLIAEQYTWFASYVLLPARMDTLMFGVLVAHLLRQEHIVERLKENLSLVYSVVVILSLPLYVNYLGYAEIGTMTFSLLAAIYGAIVLLSVIHGGGVFSRFFRSRFLAFTGLISYAMYMYHQAINGLMHGFILDQAPAFDSWQSGAVTAGSVALAYVISYASYVLMERPIRHWGHRFKY